MESFSFQADNQAITRRVEPNSPGNEPRPLVFVFFALFAVNLDSSFQVEGAERLSCAGVDRKRQRTAALQDAGALPDQS
jgi:hypothetical protein